MDKHKDTIRGWANTIHAIFGGMIVWSVILVGMSFNSGVTSIVSVAF